jgi:hypothetical protein
MIHHTVRVGGYTVLVRAWPSDDAWTIEVYELPWQNTEEYHHPIGTYCAEEAESIADIVAKKYENADGRL